MKIKRRVTYFLSTIIILGLIFINFLIQVGVDPSYRVMYTDSGTFAYCGQIIRNGGLMYRDCWDNKPPGVYYLDALAIRLGGSSPFAIWLFQAIWLSIAIAIFYLIMNRIWESQALAAVGAFVLLLVLLYPGIFQGGNLTETYDILPVVLALGALWAYLNTGHRRWLVAIGLLTAAGFLLKPTYIAIGLATGLLVIYLGLRQRKNTGLLINLVLLAVSAMIPLALVGFYWVLRHDFYELWFAVFAHNFTYIQEGFSLRTLYGTARMFLYEQPMASLTSLVVMSIVALLAQHGRKIIQSGTLSSDEVNSFTPGRMDRMQVLVWLLIGVFVSTILDVIFLASSGKNFGHYLQVLVPAMVVSVLYLIYFLGQAFRQDSTGRHLQAIILAAILILSFSGGLEIASKERPSLQVLKSFFTTPNLTLYQPTELEQYILDHSSSSDTVLIWAGHPSMNFVTRRQSPTRYIFLLHLFTPTPNGTNGFNELLQDLEAKPPMLIVVQPVSSIGLPDITSASEPVCAGCDASILAGLSDLHQFVKSRYALTYSIWDWVVYSRIR